MRKAVIICESQPLMVEGLRALLDSSPELELTCACGSLAACEDLVRQLAPAVVVLDKSFGAQSVLETVERLRISVPSAAIAVWGVSITDPEALRFGRAGARGIVRKSADLETVLVCLRSVAAGATWMEQNVFHDPPRGRSKLTARERQVMELVGQGLKNREVALELGIQPATVKVHLKHIFEKTGAQDRYSLAMHDLLPAMSSSRQSQEAGWSSALRVTEGL